MLAD
jgi:hypothetical protein